MGADYSFEPISIETYVPQFIGHNKFFLGSVLRQGQLECVLRSVPQQTDGVNCSSICFLQSKWALERTLVHYGLNLFIKAHPTSDQNLRNF